MKARTEERRRAFICFTCRGGLKPVKIPSAVYRDVTRGGFISPAHSVSGGEGHAFDEWTAQLVAAGEDSAPQ